MYGKLLEFLRVSSLDPEFLIQCPDPENFFPPRTGFETRRFGGGILPSATDANSRAYARARHARDRLSIRILRDSDKFSGGGK